MTTDERRDLKRLLRQAMNRFLVRPTSSNWQTVLGLMNIYQKNDWERDHEN